MGIINTIISSNDDLKKPDKKSYSGYSLDIRLVNADEIRKKKMTLLSERNALKVELSDKESCRELIVLNNKKAKLGRLSTSQVKDIFDDMGFNVDVILSKSHESDFSAVMNIGGYVIPMWVKIVRAVSKIFPSREKMLLTKLAPGKDRLHVRMFEGNDGAWLIIAHTDHNWMSLNLFQVFKSHFGNGGGDYITGVRMMYELLKKFDYFVGINKTFPSDEVIKTVNWAYYQSVADKLKESVRSVKK